MTNTMNRMVQDGGSFASYTPGSDATVRALAAALPPEALYLTLLVLTADAVLSAALLWRHHDTELLSLHAVAARLRA